MEKNCKFTWIKSRNNSTIVETTLYPQPDALYLLNEPECFKDLLHAIEYQKKDLKIAKTIVYTLIDELNLVKNRDILDGYYKNLKSVKNLDDILLSLSNLKMIYQICLPELSVNHRFTLKEADLSKLEEIKNRNPKLVASLVVKKLIKIYCYNKINDFSFEKIEELYNFSNTFPDKNLIYSDAGFIFTDIDFNKVNEATKPEIIPAIRKAFVDRVQHLCITCRNASPDKCDKVFEPWGNKDNIKEYDFITDGYQTYINDQMERFIVTGCKNYKPDKTTKKVNDWNANKLKNNLKLLYFGTETVEEADKLQKELLIRGQLKFATNHNVSRNTNKIKKIEYD